MNEEMLILITDSFFSYLRMTVILHRLHRMTAWWIGNNVEGNCHGLL